MQNCGVAISNGMSISKKLAGLIIVAVLVVGMAVGFWVSRGPAGVLADNDAIDDETVDGETLDDLYEAVFHRPADVGGRGFHLGRRFKDVLRDFRSSQEMRYYGALFKAIKAYEEAVRAPGELSATDKQRYLDTIDSAMATLLAWVATLPDQDICRAVVDHQRAIEAIKTAYEGMSPTAKAAAEHGIFNALKQLGKPHFLPVASKRCLSPSPSVSPSVSPTVSPTTSPTISPTASPTPTPTPTP